MKKVLEYLQNKFVKNRTIGFYIGLGSALLLLILSVAFYIAVYDQIGTTTHYGMSPNTIFLVMLLASLSFLLVVFIDHEYVSPLMPLIPAIITGIGFGIHVFISAFPLADRLTDVQFFGGDPQLFLNFIYLFSIPLIGFFVNNFFKQKKINN